jgi:hypothetical protein
MSDCGENFINTKKPTIILLPEHKYRSNKKLRIGEMLWKVPEKKLENKVHNEVVIQIKNPQINTAVDHTKSKEVNLKSVQNYSPTLSQFTITNVKSTIVNNTDNK